MKKPAQYHEKLLHWLWKNRYLSSKNLYTTNHEEVNIHHPGYSNQADGPDFTNARITIGPLKWHGDVEIHWKAKDWMNHGHHTDQNFNRVILHIVYDDSDIVNVRRSDQTEVPTLCMKPFLSNSLQYFFRHYQQPHFLPCAGNLSTVPSQLLTEQFGHAQTKYFEQKVDDFLNFYDPSLPLSKSWKRALIIALFDGLGISHNREPMRKLARKLLNDPQNMSPVNKLIKKALSLAGVQPECSKNPYKWKRKGSRPANHPVNRIRQGCYIMEFILSKSIKWWIRSGIKESFKTMIRQIEVTPGIGNQRSGVLFGTKWLPAYYLLGDLTGMQGLKADATQSWKKHRTKIPVSITKHFHKTDIPAEIFEKKLATVYQYRTYCAPRQCQQCKIFKHIISS